MFDLTGFVKTAVDNVTKEAMSRATKASKELRNASFDVLRGQRSGRVYNVPAAVTGTAIGKDGKRRKRKPAKYTASAPGEPPAVRTGAFRLGWQMRPEAVKTSTGAQIKPQIYNVVTYGKNARLLAELLEKGGGRIKPRPFEEQIKQKALPKILSIYKKPYKID